jgi:hypothetical protein
LSTTTVRVDVGSGEEVGSLAFGEPTPDTVGFVELEGMGEAGVADVAGSADRLGLAFTTEPVLLALGRQRCEEDLDPTSTCRLGLPDTAGHVVVIVAL